VIATPIGVKLLEEVVRLLQEEEALQGSNQ
jgi:hypothetical protein